MSHWEAEFRGNCPLQQPLRATCLSEYQKPNNPLSREFIGGDYSGCQITGLQRFGVSPTEYEPKSTLRSNPHGNLRWLINYLIIGLRSRLAGVNYRNEGNHRNVHQSFVLGRVNFTNYEVCPTDVLRGIAWAQMTAPRYVKVDTTTEFR